MPIEILFLIAILVMSVVAHEVSHGYAADYLGDPTARLEGRLTLNPIKHIDLFGSIILPALLIVSQSPFLFGYAKPVPYNPYNLRNRRWGEAFVAAAGSLVNISLAVFFALIINFFGSSLPQNVLVLSVVIVFVNFLLGIFNMIPIPPLDGSKVLKSLLPFHLSLAMEKLEAFIMQWGAFAFLGIILIFYFFLAPAFSSLVLLLASATTGLHPGEIITVLQSFF